MPFIHTFCTWFSVRMGSVIVGTLSLIQAALILVVAVAVLKNHADISAQLENMGEEIDLMFMKPYFQHLQKNTQQVLIIVLVFIILYILSCMLLLHGSFYLKEWELVPYIVLEFLRLVSSIIVIVFGLLLVKRNVLDFNILIIGVVSSGFITLILSYFWLCPLSLLQCMMIIRKRKVKHATYPLSTMNSNKPDLSHLYTYLYDFHMQPIMFNRNFYRHNTGNLTPLQF